MNISGPAAVAKPEMLFYAPGDLTVTQGRLEAVLQAKKQMKWRQTPKACRRFCYFINSYSKSTGTISEL